MSVDQALGLAKARSRALQSLTLRQAIAEGRVEGVTGIRNPELRVGDVSTDYVQERFDDLELGLRWRPRRLGETDVERRRRELRVVEVSGEAIRLTQRLAAKVRRTHARLVFHEGLVTLRQRQLDVQVRRVEQVDGLVELGRRTVVYRTKARSLLAQARSALTRASHNRSRAERDLQRLVGAEGPLAAATSPTPRIPSSVDALVAVAMTRRPEAAVVKRHRLLTESQHERDRLRNVPWPSFVEAKYHVDARDPDRVELLFGLDLPLWDWNEANIRVGALATDRQETEAAALIERVGDEVREAHALWLEAYLDWELTAADSKALIEQARFVVERAAVHGTVPPDELSELELLVLTTQEQVLGKRYGVDRSVAELCLAIGVEGPADLEPLEVVGDR